MSPPLRKTLPSWGWGAALVTTLAVFGCSPSGPPSIAVRDAWSRPSPAGARFGVVYMTLVSDRDDRLVGVRVPATIADHAEMHETITAASGEMSMRRVDAVPLRARTAVAFRPGGNHVMLVDLAHPLAAGDTLDVELRFDRAPSLSIRVPVRGE